MDNNIPIPVDDLLGNVLENSNDERINARLTALVPFLVGGRPPRLPWATNPLFDRQGWIQLQDDMEAWCLNTIGTGLVVFLGSVADPEGRAVQTSFLAESKALVLKYILNNNHFPAQDEDPVRGPGEPAPEPNGLPEFLQPFYDAEQDPEGNVEIMAPRLLRAVLPRSPVTGREKLLLVRSCRRRGPLFATVSDVFDFSLKRHPSVAARQDQGPRLGRVPVSKFGSCTFAIELGLIGTALDSAGDENKVELRVAGYVLSSTSLAPMAVEDPKTELYRSGYAVVGRNGPIALTFGYRSDQPLSSLGDNVEAVFMLFAVHSSGAVTIEAGSNLRFTFEDE